MRGVSVRLSELVKLNPRVIVEEDILKKFGTLKCTLRNYNGKEYVTGYKLGKDFLLHRLILETDKQVDHINGNTLDYRKENLREATGQQNQANRKELNINNLSGYKGVCWNKKANKWQAQIGLNRKQKYLGLYSSIEDAARAYNRAATKYFGEFAHLNNV